MRSELLMIKRYPYMPHIFIKLIYFTIHILYVIG